MTAHASIVQSGAPVPTAYFVDSGSVFDEQFDSSELAIASSVNERRQLIIVAEIEAVLMNPVVECELQSRKVALSRSAVNCLLYHPLKHNFQNRKRKEETALSD